MKQFLVFLFLLCSASASAQDVIVKKDGSTIVCRVVELTDSEITYKKWSDLNGSNYVMNRADASAINYQNGKKVNLSEATNLYTPNNQNDGTQLYNDNALLEMDAAEHQRKKIHRKFKWNIKLGYSLDNMTGSRGSYSSSSGADIGAGVLYKFKTSDFFIGGDVFLSSYATQRKDIPSKKLSAWGVGANPYVGYGFVLSENISINPYFGPWFCLTGADQDDSWWFNGYGNDLDNRWSLNIHNRIDIGINVGFDFFITKYFYFDVHYKKGFAPQGSLKYYHASDVHLHSSKFVAGVGILF